MNHIFTSLYIKKDGKGMEKINRERYLENLIDNYDNLVFSICFKITGDYFEAQDLSQETFLSVYKHLDYFDGKNEKAWICRIATNKCLDYVKSAGRRQIPTKDEYFLQIENKSETPLEGILENEVKNKLYHLCESLKPPYNEVAVDYFCKELKIKDIAEKTGKNKKTLQTQVYRAKGMLRKLWRKECEQNESKV